MIDQFQGKKSEKNMVFLQPMEFLFHYKNVFFSPSYVCFFFFRKRGFESLGEVEALSGLPPEWQEWQGDWGIGFLTMGSERCK